MAREIADPAAAAEWKVAGANASRQQRREPRLGKNSATARSPPRGATRAAQEVKLKIPRTGRSPASR